MPHRWRKLQECAAPSSCGAPTGTVGGGAGCSTVKPADGQPCTSSVGPAGEHFCCHYFDDGSKCADGWKCTYKGAGSTAFWGAGKNCGFDVSACDEGRPCGAVFEQSGRCLVQCTRVCSCDAPTGKLKCTALACP